MESTTEDDLDKEVILAKGKIEFVTYDEALAIVSKKPFDRFQLVMMIAVICGINSVELILYGLQFLEKVG